ncbi:hypothetical protein [Capnocytophaga cynodegmi]|uniref:Putative Bacteriocin carnobacteriocin-A n=1 Tax=Capnocytophaga cynodegmi TaxID=28189 RepID=A0A0B7HHM3_9FLAO|nr:hypothetical protein [Capnocytophaga cynodegmi]CEN38740.1 putative Bacteriocin carnobacteriocin-A [Capnocytophaga cynodegmi]
MKKLNLKQMEKVQGGADIWQDKQACEDFALGLGGASLILGFSGIGTLISGFVGLAGFGMSLRCRVL